MFLYSTASSPAVKPTQQPIQWVMGTLSSGLKRPEREADHSPPSNAEVWKGGAISPLPHTSSRHDGQRYLCFMYDIRTTLVKNTKAN
jgi:hypothetical protein